MFSTIIAYGEEITTKATNHRYDPGANLQGQIYMNFESVLWIVT